MDASPAETNSRSHEIKLDEAAEIGHFFASKLFVNPVNMNATVQFKSIAMRQASSRYVSVSAVRFEPDWLHSLNLATPRRRRRTKAPVRGGHVAK